MRLDIETLKRARPDLPNAARAIDKYSKCSDNEIYALVIQRIYAIGYDKKPEFEFRVLKYL